MRRRALVNDRQGAILQRVAAGDDLATADNGDKRSANALHDRGLLVIGRSPWRAAITEAGRHYLERGRHSDDVLASVTAVGQPARQDLPTNSAANAKPTMSTSLARPRRKRPPPHTTARISAERRATATELIDELVASGEKVIKQADDSTQIYWRQVIDFAKRNQLVPDGKRIERARSSGDDLCIRLLSGSHANSRRGPGLPVVPMPTKLHSPHPVVKAIQDDSGRLRMGRSLRHRSLLYLHGLTQEAVRCGYGVQEQPIANRYRGRITTYGRPGVPDYFRREGELNIVVNGFSYRITIDQEHPETEDDDRYDQLVVTVRGPGQPHGCRYRWYDRKRTTIDDSIVPVLRELEAWAATAKRRKDDRQARWQAAMDQAIRMATHDYQVTSLEQQVQSWRQNRDLRQYCDALEARILDADDDEPVDEARRWLAWARDHAKTMDPLFQLSVTPMPKLRPEDLEPYLDGWSPHGPDEYRPRRWR